MGTCLFCEPMAHREYRVKITKFGLPFWLKRQKMFFTNNRFRSLLTDLKSKTY